MLIATKTKKDFKAVVKHLGYDLSDKAFDKHGAKTVVNSERQAFGNSDFLRKNDEVTPASEFLEFAPKDDLKVEGETDRTIEELRAIYKKQNDKSVAVAFKNNAKWIESKIDWEQVEAEELAAKEANGDEEE